MVAFGIGGQRVGGDDGDTVIARLKSPVLP